MVRRFVTIMVIMAVRRREVMGVKALLSRMVIIEVLVLSES